MNNGERFPLRALVFNNHEHKSFLKSTRVDTPAAFMIILSFVIKYVLTGGRPIIKEEKNSALNAELKIINVDSLILCIIDLSGNNRVITNSR